MLCECTVLYICVRILVDVYRVTNRGGKGVKTINITDKTGKLIAIKDVTDNDDVINN